MIPWSLLDTAQVPGGDGELRLMRRGAEFSIRLGHTELMNSRRSGSEEALATIVCVRIRGRARPRILIGGLGMGFTLRAALAALGSEARVIVAELVPAVVTWARGPMLEVFGDSLTDPRVSIHEADVGHLIRSGRSTFDAILLDVDNGPEGLTRKANNGLYDAEGLSAARASLRSGGVLAVWSSGPDLQFTQRLRKTGFDVDEVACAPTERVAARGTSSGSRPAPIVDIRRPNSDNSFGHKQPLARSFALDFGQGLLTQRSPRDLPHRTRAPTWRRRPSERCPPD